MYIPIVLIQNNNNNISIDWMVPSYPLKPIQKWERKEKKRKGSDVCKLRNNV